jgi:hypothetical protein
MTDGADAAAARAGDRAAQRAGRIQNPDALLQALAALEVEFEQLFAEWQAAANG